MPSPQLPSITPHAPPPPVSQQRPHAPAGGVPGVPTRTQPAQPRPLLPPAKLLHPAQGRGQDTGLHTGGGEGRGVGAKYRPSYRCGEGGGVQDTGFHLPTEV